MKKIDLHIHSHYSDGTDSPEAIVRKAKEKKIDLIALTDHNTIDGIVEFQAACLKYQQAALSGIEISTYYIDQEIHLLGYYPLMSDFKQKQYTPLIDLINEYQTIKVRQNEGIINKLAKKFSQISIDDFYQFASTVAKKQNLNRLHIAKYLVALNIADDNNDALNNYINENGPFFVSKKPIDLFKAIDVIKQTGGLPVIAHLGEYHFTLNQANDFIEKCLNDVAGFECYHPLNTLEHIKMIISCSHYKPQLLLTAGSDYHGQNKQNNYLGQPCNLTLNKEAYCLYQQIMDKTYQYLLESSYISAVNSDCNIDSNKV